MLGWKDSNSSLSLYSERNSAAWKGFLILGWPQTLYIAKDDLEFLIFLPGTPGITSVHHHADAGDPA